MKIFKFMLGDIYYFFKNLSYLGVLFSPFSLPTLRIYFGKINVGVPYFLPRKWVKYTKQEAIEEATKVLGSNILTYKNKTIEELVSYFLNHKKPINKKFGFDYCSLGWKTKWSNTDFRFEWSPKISFVFFNKQIVLTLGDNDLKYDCYWEAWLFYKYATKGDKIHRIKEMIEQYDCSWKSYDQNGNEIVTNYYYQILKPKYHKYIKND